jgi:hypothetical protein
VTIIIYPACALFAWAFVLSGVRRLSSLRHDPERLAVWLMFLAFALTFTVGSSPLRRHLDGFGGIKEFSTWLAQSLVVTYSVAALALLQLWNYERTQALRRIAVSTGAVGAVLVSMAVLFFLSNRVHAGDHAFVHWYASSAYFDAYLIIYLLTFGATNIEIARLCLRFARLMTVSWLRTGLRATALGALISLVYVADRLTDLVVAHFGVNLAAWDPLPEAGASIGSMLIMLGMTMHMWGPSASGLAKRYRRLRAYRKLRPLWKALYTRDPGIALDIPSFGLARWRSIALLLRDLDYRVSRRVIEVRDGVLALRPYIDEDIVRTAREGAVRVGVPADELEAAVEAAEISAALDRSEEAEVQRDASAVPVVMNTAPEDLDAELTWLSTVAKYFKAARKRPSQAATRVTSH